MIYINGTKSSHKRPTFKTSKVHFCTYGETQTESHSVSNSLTKLKTINKKATQPVLLASCTFSTTIESEMYILVISAQNCWCWVWNSESWQMEMSATQKLTSNLLIRKKLTSFHIELWVAGQFFEALMRSNIYEMCFLNCQSESQGRDFRRASNQTSNKGQNRWKKARWVIKSSAA